MIALHLIGDPVSGETDRLVGCVTSALIQLRILE